MKNYAFLKFLVLAFPSLVISIRLWLWIINVLPPLDSNQACAGWVFCLCNYPIALAVSGVVKP